MLGNIQSKVVQWLKFSVIVRLLQNIFCCCCYYFVSQLLNFYKFVHFFTVLISQVLFIERHFLKRSCALQCPNEIHALQRIKKPQQYFNLVGGALIRYKIYIKHTYIFYVHILVNGSFVLSRAQQRRVELLSPARPHFHSPTQKVLCHRGSDNGHNTGFETHSR